MKLRSQLNRLILLLNDNLDQPAFIQQNTKRVETNLVYTCIPSLILSSIEHAPKLPALKKIGNRCLTWLQSTKEARYSYTLNHEQIYPHDIDDTSVALLAKWNWKQSLHTNELFQYLQDLIQLESEPGGPYRTWQIETNDMHWKDVDPVVNLNIGRCLVALGLLPKNLEQYLLAEWSSEVKSEYYPNQILPLYFLSDFIYRLKNKNEMSLGLTEFKGKIIKRCQELLKSNLTTDELITIYLSLYKLEKSTLLTFQEQIYEIIQTLASGSLDGLVLCLDQDHKHKRLLCSRAVTIGFAIELLSLILINQGKDHHQKTSNTLHELCISLLQHKLEDTPEPIKSIINSVATPTFLDQKNTLWNMAECCNLTQSQVTETAIKLHVDGWILGTLLNNVIDEKQTSKIASTSKEVLLTSLYLWQSSLHHLQDLEIALPTIQQFSRGLPEKTLFAWIRESQQIRQFREDRAVGHQLLYLSTCKQEKMKFFTRATSIALEAFQMSDDLKDLAQDFPEQSPIAQAKQRVVIVQRLDQLSSAFADLAQFELPYLRSSLFLLHQKAKLDILLTDVIRRFDLQKSNHHRDS